MVPSPMFGLLAQFCFAWSQGNRVINDPKTQIQRFVGWVVVCPIVGGLESSIEPSRHPLLQNMLQVDPRLRLTIDEVLNHPWLQEPDETPAVMRYLHEFGNREWALASLDLLRTWPCFLQLISFAVQYSVDALIPEAAL
jgi:serine/threonine protein kinase